jgi:hypothetical protein
MSEELHVAPWPLLCKMLCLARAFLCPTCCMRKGVYCKTFEIPWARLKCKQYPRCLLCSVIRRPNPGVNPVFALHYWLANLRGCVGEAQVRMGVGAFAGQLMPCLLSPLGLLRSMQGTNLFGALLLDAKFVGADLTGAYLESAVLDNADLSNAVLVGAQVGCSWQSEG